jgi:hypothetical protein
LHPGVSVLRWQMWAEWQVLQLRLGVKEYNKTETEGRKELISAKEATEVFQSPGSGPLLWTVWHHLVISALQVM